MLQFDINEVLHAWNLECDRTLNPRKCYYMCLCTNISNTDEFEEERVLSINIDKKPAFENYVYNIWRKDLQKLNALNPTATYCDNPKRKLIQNSSRRSALSRDFIHATPDAESSCEKLLHKFQFRHCHKILISLNWT